MDDLILINCLDRVDHLYSFIYHNIRELGVKLPKAKKLNKLNQSRKSVSVSEQQQQQDENSSRKIFGESLTIIPKRFLQDYGFVPEFLVQACEIIEHHLHCEGLFRKSGSVNRQKELRLAVDEGKPLDGANVFDTAVLIKQFFRELPEPLFLTVYLDAFIKCYQLPPDKDPKRALLQLCLLLPLENIGALRYIMHMLSRVAAMCDKNKMTANNLALLMAPNMMHSNKGTQKMSSSEEKLLHVQTCIVELLIKNWEQIGMVGSSLQHQSCDVASFSFRSTDSRVSLMSECFGTDDDLEASDDNTLEDSKEVTQKVRRKRSSSLTGFVSSIAQGLAKLRRSTDGRGVNMSLNGSQKNGLSVASCSNANPTCDAYAATVTPCVMRKRRASGENMPFSTSKKKAILGNLPQQSALASTPFTPASTVRKNQDLRSLNITTPAMGNKTARKKLTLFTSPGKVKRETSTSPPTLRSKSKSKSFFKRLSGSRPDKVSDESVNSLPRSVSSPTLLEGATVSSHNSVETAEKLVSTKCKVKKNSISEPSPIIVPVCVDAIDAQPGVELRRSRRDEFEQKRKMLIQSVKESKASDVIEYVEGCSTSMTDQFDARQIFLPPPPGFGDQTVSDANDGENEEVDVGSDLESEAGFSTISGGTVIHLAECGGHRKQTAHTVSGSSLVSSVSRQIASSMHSLCSMESVESQTSGGKPSQEDQDKCSDVMQDKNKVNDEEEEVWVRQKPSYTQESHDPIYTHLQTTTISSHQTSLDISSRHAGASRKKSISAEDLQSAQKKVNVPVRAHSMYLSPCKKYNFKPHLEISKQTHNLLARAGYLQPTDSEAKDVPVPVKSPKRSSYREEMMMSLRSSFHERHAQNNVSFRSLRDLPSSTLTKGKVTSNSMELTNIDSGCAISSITIIKESLRGCGDVKLKSPLSNESQTESLLDVTDGEVDVTGLDVTVVGKVTDNASDTVDVNDIESYLMNDVKNPAANMTSVDMTLLEDSVVSQISSSSDEMDTDATEAETNTDSQVHSEETGHVSAPIHNLKNIKSALTLSGILDQEIINQVKIKRAEVSIQKHDSVLNVQQAGLVSQSIRQFSQHQPSRSHEPVFTRRSVSKRGKSPVRIPTIFAKNHEKARHYRQRLQMTRERTGYLDLSELASGKEETLGGDDNMSPTPQEDPASDFPFVVPESVTPAGSPPTTPVNRMQVDLSESLMETINDICTPRAEKRRPAEPGQQLKSPLKESTNQIQSALVASLKAANAQENVKFRSAVRTPHRVPLPNELKPQQLPSSARNQRPQIKRLRVQYSPRRINHRSPKTSSPFKSPKMGVPKQH